MKLRRQLHGKSMSTAPFCVIRAAFPPKCYTHATARVVATATQTQTTHAAVNLMRQYARNLTTACAVCQWLALKFGESARQCAKCVMATAHCQCWATFPNWRQPGQSTTLMPAQRIVCAFDVPPQVCVILRVFASHYLLLPRLGDRT